MLPGELRALTDDRCTIEEYEAIDEIYRNCPHMTHQDAANLWRQMYGTPDD